jgi:hypothetical protein
VNIRNILGSALLLFPVITSTQDLGPHATQSVRSREAWQLTDDERITARLDPEKIRQRMAAHASAMNRLHGSGASSGMSMSSGQPLMFRIDGAENPELFLPFELFANLLRGVDMKLTPNDRQMARAMLEPKIKTFGFEPEAFWTALGSSTTGYFKARDGGGLTAASKRARTEATPSPSGPNDGHIALCRGRLMALSSARDHFGRETFDRFLYTVVAPTLTVTSSPPGPDEGSGLRYLAGGCQ